MYLLPWHSADFSLFPMCSPCSVWQKAAAPGLCGLAVLTCIADGFGNLGVKGALCLVWEVWGHRVGVWPGEEHVSSQMGTTSGFL